MNWGVIAYGVVLFSFALIIKKPIQMAAKIKPPESEACKELMYRRASSFNRCCALPDVAGVDAPAPDNVADAPAPGSRR